MGFSIAEASGGYHFDAWHGINVDAGIFASYIGLFSYYNAENWMYQPSFASDFVPWFFNGVRVQAAPTDRLELELWLVNGWQSYENYNKAVGVGGQALWRPEEAVELVTNEYIGYDTPCEPQRWRFHSDNSAVIRYSNHPGAFINRAAFSITQDIGFESGDGVSPFGENGLPRQNFISGMVYHRLWMKNDHFAWTFGGGYVFNPGRYMVLPLPGAADTALCMMPGSKFAGWDCSTGVDWMPNDLLDWHIEVVHRETNVPYFAGPGGVTSPDGYTTTPIPPGWSPDLVTAETQLVLALLVHF